MGLYPSANPSLLSRDAQCLLSDRMSTGPGARIHSGLPTRPLTYLFAPYLMPAG